MGLGVGHKMRGMCWAGSLEERRVEAGARGGNWGDFGEVHDFGEGWAGAYVGPLGRDCPRD